MNYKLITKFLMVFIIAGLGLALIPAQAADPSLRKTESELQAIQKKIQETRQKQENAKKQEVSVLRQMDSINQKIRVQEKQLQSLQGQLQKNQSQTGLLQKELESTHHQLNLHQAYLALRIRSIYLAHRLSPIRQLLTTPNYADHIREFQYQRILAYSDARSLGNVRQEAYQISKQKFEISELIRYQTIQKNELDTSKKQYVSEKSQKSSLLTQIRNDKATYEKTVRELQASARRLENLIAELMKPKEEKFPEGFAGGNFAQLRGKLSWPVGGGRVIYTPGKHKILGDQVEIYSHGIGIQAPTGADVYAVNEGLVRYAGWLEGSGNTVIIDHGQQYMTLYMHLSAISVSKGSMVSHRQRIGSVGDTGSLEGSQLEFQIRKGTSTQNPLEWLSRR